jgi:hypothetical protein
VPVHVQYMHDIPMICSQGLDSERNGRKCVQREQCDDVKARSVGSGFARLTQMKLEQRVKFETATACLRHRWVSIQAVVRVMGFHSSGGACDGFPFKRWCVRWVSIQAVVRAMGFHSSGGACNASHV